LTGLMDTVQLHINPDTPQIYWPLSFETALSTNDPGLNITEKIFFVSQINYNISINSS
jgi:hypothetical protein